MTHDAPRNPAAALNIHIFQDDISQIPVSKGGHLADVAKERDIRFGFALNHEVFDAVVPTVEDAQIRVRFASNNIEVLKALHIDLLSDHKVFGHIIWVIPDGVEVRGGADKIGVVDLSATATEGGGAGVAVRLNLNAPNKLNNVADDLYRRVNLQRFGAGLAGAHRTGGQAGGVGFGASPVGIPLAGCAKQRRAPHDGIAEGVKELNRDGDTRGLVDDAICPRNAGRLGGGRAGEDLEIIAADRDP